MDGILELREANPAARFIVRVPGCAESSVWVDGQGYVVPTLRKLWRGTI